MYRRGSRAIKAKKRGGGGVIVNTNDWSSCMSAAFIDVTGQFFIIGVEKYAETVVSCSLIIYAKSTYDILRRYAAGFNEKSIVSTVMSS